MTDGKNETALTVRTNNTALRNKTAKVSVIQRAEVGATQSQLRHKTALMTMRYLKTLSADESLRIQQTVDFRW